jgi:hypothetical protein
MNMFMFMKPPARRLTAPAWGFWVGLGSVGIPVAVMIALSGERGNGWAWLIGLASALVGGGYAALLALGRSAGRVPKAGRLGAAAWMTVTVVMTLLIAPFMFYVIFLLIVTLPLSAIFGAGMGGVLGWLLAPISPEPAPPKVRRSRSSAGA